MVSMASLHKDGVVMKWRVKELDTFLQAKEYVDTAIIPLIPISFKDDVKMTVSMGEFISIMTDELERQFHGRVFQLPAFTYLKEEDKESRNIRLKNWINYLKETNFKVVILLTSDYEWKTGGSEIEDNLIWLPTLPLDSMDREYQIQVINDQMKQLIPILMDKWKNIKFE